MAAIALVGNMIASGGGPASGCKLTSCIRSTSTPSPLYSDVGLTTHTTNPYVSDADGRLDFYFSSLIQYTWTVRTSDDATIIWQADIVGGVVTVTYADGILIHSTWAPPLATALGTRWTGVFGLARPQFDVWAYIVAAGLETADDQSAGVLACAADVAAIGGGTMYWRDGTYRFKGLRGASNTRYVGQTKGKVIWKPPVAGLASNEYLYFNTNSGAYTDFDIEMENITIDGDDLGNVFAQTTRSPLVNFSRVTRLKLRNIRSTNYGYIPMACAGIRDSSIVDCEADGIGFQGDARTATITQATPAVVTIANHGLTVGQAFRFSTTGGLPTGITAGLAYYVMATGLATNTFQFTATWGGAGAAVNTSSAGTGVHTVTTHSSNGGSGLWISKVGTDQTERTTIINFRARETYWTALEVHGIDITILGGGAKTVREAGIYAPHIPAADILNTGMKIVGFTVDGVIQSDISGSGYELAGIGGQVIGSSSANTDHAGFLWTDSQIWTVSGNAAKNFNKDSRGITPQGTAFGIITSSASPDQPQDMLFTGNTADDDQMVVTGYAAFAVGGGGASAVNIRAIGNNFGDVAWTSGNPLLTTKFGVGCFARSNDHAADTVATRITRFLGSGTYTPSDGITSIIVELVGGGGSGAGATASASQVSAGGGGGAGGYSIERILAAALGATETVTIGAGGAAPTAGNNAGNAGGTTSFGSLLSATGGSGGGTSSTAAVIGVAGTDAGAGSGGDVNAQGGAGGGATARFSDAIVLGGGGGDSYFGGGGAARLTFGAASVAGRQGGNYGAGGSGGVSIDAGGAVAGGAGAAGVVIVTEYF